MQVLAEHVQNGTVHTDGMGRLQALLGSNEGTQDESTASAERALQSALAGISAAPLITTAAAQLMPGAATSTQQTSTIAPGMETGGLSSSDQAVKDLSAEVMAGAQRAALEAICSSVQVRPRNHPTYEPLMCAPDSACMSACTMQVAEDAVKELPAWAGPDVIIAATMSRLDGIVAAANAQA